MLLASIIALTVSQSNPSWSIHPSGTMIWNGQPYVPIGVRIPGTVEAVRLAAEDGIRDVLLELPADGRGWVQTLEAAKELDLRFMIEVNSMAPASEGVTVEPESYRLTGITQKTRVRATMPGASGALIVLAGLDGEIAQVRRVPTTPIGSIDEEVDPVNTLEHIALVYPIKHDARVPDAWAGLDSHRDGLIQAFEKSGAQPGLRGVLNPMGTVPRFPDAEQRFVPFSSRFRLELEAFLRRKYGTLKRAEQAWAIAAPDFSSYRELTQLVPLWSSRRGVGHLWDPTTDRTYRCESRTSQAWSDIQTVLNTAIRRRAINLSQTLQAQLGVPVLQTWSGWNGPYEGNAAGLAGVAVRLDGDSFSSLIEGAARAASTLSRWQDSGLLLASEVSLPESDDFKSSLDTLIAESKSLGMRGWFASVGSSAARKTLVEAAGAATSDSSWLTPRPLFLNFPESAQNPAVPMRLKSGLWWVPAPLDGNRIDYGRHISGYRMRSRDGDQTVFWSNAEPRKIKLRFLDPKSVSIRQADGEPIQTKVGRREIEMTLGTTPVIVTSAEIPVPQECVDETIDEFTAMVSMVPNQVQNLLDDLEAFRQISTTMNENPSGAYLGMRGRLERVKRSLAPVVWIEAENSRAHNFSEVLADPSASGASALSLSTKLMPLVPSFQATYTANLRLEGQQEIWLSVKGPREVLRQIRAQVNDQQLEPDDAPPISFYGTGFGWIKLGSARLVGRQVSVQISVPAPLSGSVILDTLVISGAGYRPNGAFLNWNPVLPSPPPRRR